MLTLYDLSKRYTELISLAADEDGSTAFSDTLEGLEDEIEIKISNCAAVCRTLDLESEALKKEADRLSRRGGAIQRNLYRLKSYMMHCMEVSGLRSVRGDCFTVWIQDSPASVLFSAGMEDPAGLPEEFRRLRVEADKLAIRDALERGREIPGCQLVRSRAIRIH